jgi:hypothetical protein
MDKEGNVLGGRKDMLYGFDNGRLLKEEEKGITFFFVFYPRWIIEANGF